MEDINIMHMMKEIHGLTDDVIETRSKSYENFLVNDFKLMESERAIFDWACKQTYIALGNMMPAAAQVGIDSCPIEGFDRERLEDMFENEGILDREKFGISCMAAFGYRAKEQRPKTRQAMDAIVRWV